MSSLCSAGVYGLELVFLSYPATWVHSSYLRSSPVSFPRSPGILFALFLSFFSSTTGCTHLCDDFFFFKFSTWSFNNMLDIEPLDQKENHHSQESFLKKLPLTLVFSNLKVIITDKSFFYVPNPSRTRSELSSLWILLTVITPCPLAMWLQGQTFISRSYAN